MISIGVISMGLVLIVSIGVMSMGVMSIRKTCFTNLNGYAYNFAELG